jgi:hypothetical protein
MPRRELLVEGTDDLHVMSALFMAHKLPDDFKVVKPKDDQGGVDELFKTVPTRLKQSDLERIGIVVDADEHVLSRWATIKSILEQSGCANVPTSPTPQGFVMQIPDGPKVGVWIMPDNKEPGILESFLAFLTPPTDLLLMHVNTFIDSIPDHCNRCPNVRIPKARIHAWLAVQKEPGKPLGQAITAKYLDPTVSQVEVFLKWVRTVLID